jgi:hypothetical protein
LTTVGKFNTLIVDNLCTEIGQAELTTIGDAEHNYRMRLLSSEIINWKIDNKFEDHPLVRNLSNVVDELLRRKGPFDRKVSQQLREEYTKKLCDTMKGFSYQHFKFLVSVQEEDYDNVFPDWSLRIAQAAMGDIEVLNRKWDTYCHVLSPHVFFLPNMLEAAIATNQVGTVDKILEFLVTYIEAEWDIGTRVDVKIIAQALGEALRVAVRLSKDTIGFKIIDFLRNHWNRSGKWVRWALINKIYDDCIEYGNSALFPTIFYRKEQEELPLTNTGPWIKMDKSDFKHIMHSSASTNFLRRIIHKGILNLHRVEDINLYNYHHGSERPLWIALSARKYKFAKRLIDAGANIDEKLPGSGGTTAYLQAREERKGDDQYYLLLWGADFRQLKYHGRPWAAGEKEAKPWIETKSGSSVAFKDWEPGKRRRRRDSWDDY